MPFLPNPAIKRLADLLAIGVTLAIGIAILAAQAGKAPTPLALAETHYEKGDCQKVIETLSTYVGSQAPGDTPYWLFAECSIRLGREEDAIRALRSGVQVNPKSGILKLQLGQALFRKDPVSAEAGEMLRLASLAAPKDPESRHYYAQWAYLNNRDEICARNEIEGLRAPGLADLAKLQMHTLLGMCQSRLDQTEAARASFEAARNINLRSPQFDAASAHQHVRFLTLSGEKSEIDALVGEILRHAPNFGPARLERAKSFDRARNAAKAIEEAKLALEGEGADFAIIRAAHLLLAKNYFALGETQKAEEEQKWVESHVTPSR